MMQKIGNTEKNYAGKNEKQRKQNYGIDLEFLCGINKRKTGFLENNIYTKCLKWQR